MGGAGRGDGGRLAACWRRSAWRWPPPRPRTRAAKDGVLSVRFGGDQSETRVVIELDKAAKGRVIDGGRRKRRGPSPCRDVGAAADLQGHGQGLVAAWTVDRRGRRGAA